MEALSDLAEEWELTLGEVSPGSREVYLRGVRQCAAWLGEAHAELTEPGEVTHRHIHEWQRALADLGRSKAIRRVRFIAVRLFLGYLASEPDTGVSGHRRRRPRPAGSGDRPAAHQGWSWPDRSCRVEAALAKGRI